MMNCGHNFPESNLSEDLLLGVDDYKEDLSEDSLEETVERVVDKKLRQHRKILLKEIKDLLIKYKEK